MPMRILYYTASPVALFLLWEICAHTGLLDARFFPPPSTIFHHLFFVSPEEGILRDISASLYRIVWGYALGCSLGIMVALGMALSRLLNAVFYPVVAMTYPLPKIAILPLIMLIFGIGELSKVVVVAIGSFFLVLMNTLNGIRGLSPIFMDVARVHRINTARTIRHIILPGALPSIFTGLRLAIGYSLVIVVAAEFSGANEGIGYLIWQSWETFSIKSMYAGIFVIAALGLAFSLLIDILERILIPWRGAQLQ